MRTKFYIRHQGNEALSDSALRLESFPCKPGLGDKLSPAFYLNTFLSETTGPNVLEIIWGL